MKYLLKIFLALCLFLLADLYLTRAYFLSTILYKIAYTKRFDFGGAYEASDDFIYTIKQINPEEYTFTIKHQSPFPKLLYAYRDQRIFCTLDDRTLWSHALRDNIIYKKDSLKAHYGYDCKTGLGLISINPFESFEITSRLEDFVDFLDLSKCVEKIDTVYYHQTNSRSLSKGKQQEEGNWVNKIPIQQSDSITVQFALHYYSFLTGKSKGAYANELKFNYQQIIDIRAAKRAAVYKTRN